LIANPPETHLQIKKIEQVASRRIATGYPYPFHIVSQFRSEAMLNKMQSKANTSSDLLLKMLLGMMFGKQSITVKAPAHNDPILFGKPV
jgi:hypothetical protein